MACSLLGEWRGGPAHVGWIFPENGLVRIDRRLFREPRAGTAQVADLEDCIFCKIIDRQEHAIVVYEDEYSIAFLDKHPLNPGHTLVVPRKHYAFMHEMPLEEVGRLFVSVAKVMRGVRKASRADGINIGQSNGQAASQEVFHMHVHVIPRFTSDSSGGLTFPERKMMGLADRESMGTRIREAVEATS